MQKTEGQINEAAKHSGVHRTTLYRLDSKILLYLQAAERIEVSMTSRLVLNRYQILKLLGEGGMGRVYLVRDLWKKPEEKPLPLALKFLPRQATAGEIASFKQEFEVLRQLNHPHLAQVYDFGFDAERNQHFFHFRIF